MNDILAKKTRVEYIDIFRSFGIILMIMGHIKFGVHFDKWIHAFHMPMFFFISGWFFRSRDDAGAHIGKKARSLLLPYTVFELTQWGILSVVIPEYRTVGTLVWIFTENTHKIPVESGAQGISPVPGAMWFLTSIFLCETIYILLDRILGCNWRLHMVAASLVVLGMTAPAILPVRLPWAMDVSFVGIGFYHIARMMKGNRISKLLDLKINQTILCGVIISILIMVSPGINMRTGQYGLFFPFWINAFGAIVAGWNLSRYINQTLQHGIVKKTISDWMKGIGENSIVYLCLNQTVILAVTMILNITGIERHAARILTLILTMAVLLAFEKILCRTKLRILTGKP